MNSSASPSVPNGSSTHSTENREGISRRTLLKTTTATGFALTGVGAASGSPLEDNDYRERDWGYQRKSLEFDKSREWPIVMEYAGYGNVSWAGGPNLYLRMPDGVLIAMRVEFNKGPQENYARITANIRGTGCSGGSFNLYDRRHAWDGHEIIEWAAAQSWSNGKIGMKGCSFMGQTPYWVATTQPPSLETIMVGGLHSDIYKDLVYPGGVQNTAFPVIWYFQGPNRAPINAAQNGTVPEDRICTQNQVGRYNTDRLPLPTEYLTNFADSTYGDWWVVHSARHHADAIDIPYYQWVNWQDEQVGPRAAVLWDWIDPPEREIAVPGEGSVSVTPKKLVTSTGSHCMGGYDGRDMWDWMDIWLRDKPDTAGLFEHRVETYFESRGGAEYSTVTYSDQWPSEETTWRRGYFHEGGKLDFQAPTGSESTDTYVSGVPRDNWFFYAPRAGKEARQADGLPDSIAFETDPFEETVTIAGPMLLEYYASLSGVDTNFFVTVNDVYPDGSISYLQRGLLRASMRAVNEDRSYKTDDGLLYQPWYPFSNPTKVTPGDINRYLIEIFPHAHVFRPGHRLRVQIMTPPAADSLWGFTPKHEPAAVDIYHDADRPTNLLLPFVDVDEPIKDPPEGCGIPNGFPCDEPLPDPGLEASTGLTEAELLRSTEAT